MVIVKFLDVKEEVKKVVIIVTTHIKEGDLVGKVKQKILVNHILNLINIMVYQQAEDKDIEI